MEARLGKCRDDRISGKDNNIWESYIGKLKSIHLRLHGKKDNLVWTCAINGRYSLKDGYNVLMMKYWKGDLSWWWWVLFKMQCSLK